METISVSFALKRCMLGTMLEHQKIVLSGVADHKQLFSKELRKSLGWLNAKEQDVFEQWVREHYYHLHAETIDEVFRSSYPEAS